MKQILVLATTNPGKTREIQALLKNFPLDIKNLADFGPIPPVIEDGATFDDNAYKKAAFTARVLGYPAMADDSGLCVEAWTGPRAYVPPGMPEIMPPIPTMWTGCSKI